MTSLIFRFLSLGIAEHLVLSEKLKVSCIESLAISLIITTSGFDNREFKNIIHFLYGVCKMSAETLKIQRNRKNNRNKNCLEVLHS